jgi:hypothetical protein
MGAVREDVVSVFSKQLLLCCQNSELRYRAYRDNNFAPFSLRISNQNGAILDQ